MTEPKVTIGQRPDGTPWVIYVDFDCLVGVTGYSALKDGQFVLTPEEARRKAAVLISAAEWIESGRSGQIEKRLAADPAAAAAWTERGELPS